MSLRDRVDQLFEVVKGGDIVGAIERFYDDDVRMQENQNPPTVGKAANIEREKQFVASVKEWKSFTVDAVAVEGDENDGTAFVEYGFEFVNTEDQPVTYQQVAVQRWKGGKIASERFYYGT